MNAGPFIMKFDGYEGEKFIYCANTNRILQVEEIIYDIIEYFGVNSVAEIVDKFNNKYSFSEISNAFSQLELYQKETGFARNKRPTGIQSNLDKKEFHHKAKHGLSRINLNVTNECNMACIYCLYGEYYSSCRKPVDEYMSETVAKKAIDFLVDNSEESDHLSLGFYGGEPFLNFGLMKNTVDYFNNLNGKNGNKKMYIHVTSNCTLLNNEMIQWLIENNIGLMASFDGPKSLHDRYRKFKNGNGTFDRINSNLLGLKKRNPEYFNRNVRLNLVLAPPFEFNELYDYLMNSEFTHNIATSLLKKDDYEYFQKMEKDSGVTLSQFQDIILEFYFRHKSSEKAPGGKGNDNGLVLNRVPLGRYLTREITRSCSDILKNSMCSLGVARNFITNDGTIFPCERVKQWEGLELGNVFDGFYWANDGFLKAWSIISEYQDLLDDRCRQCWAYRFCGKRTCPKYGMSERGINGEVMDQYCELHRQQILDYLRKVLKYEREYPEIIEEIRTKQYSLFM